MEQLRTSAATCSIIPTLMPTFLSREIRGAGGNPPAGQGRLRQHVPSPSSLVLTFFSREIRGAGGIPGGARPPPAARPVIPLFFADFLFPRNQGGWGKSPGETRPPPATLPVTLDSRADFLFPRNQGGAGGSPPAGQGRLRRHVPLFRFSLLTFFSREKKVSGRRGRRRPS